MKRRRASRCWRADAADDDEDDEDEEEEGGDDVFQTDVWKIGKILKLSPEDARKQQQQQLQLHDGFS